MTNRMLLIAFLMLTGCTFMHQDFANWGKNYSKIKLQSIAVGDTKDDVIADLGEPTNVIGSKQFEQSTVEVWAYERWRAQLGYDVKDEEYWLYFLDDKLEQWGRPGDWSSEADKIYEIRYR